MSEPGVNGSEKLKESTVQESLPATGPGAVLHAQREALGWSVEHVANQLNMAPRQIHALEEDNYAALPGIVIARGFVRAYAKLLKLDPVPLVALMGEAAPAQEEAVKLRRALPSSFSASDSTRSRRGRIKAQWLVIAVLLSLLAVGAWFEQKNGWITHFMSQLGTPATEAPAMSSQPLPSPVEEAVSESNMVEAPARVPEAFTTPRGGEGEGAVPVQNKALGADVSNAAPVVAGDVVKNDSQAALGKAANSSPNLVLNVREESWIEIKQADGKVIFSRLVPAGSKESFNVAQPVALVIGNAAGVDVAFQGKALELKSTSKNNVARLNLQQQ